MSNRYEWINGETYCDSDQMYDNETGNKTQPVYVADLLNKQDQKIKDLEHRLSNCIEPKFKIGQKVYIADKYFDKVYELKINSIRISRFKDKHFNSISYDGHLEENLFATEEEAKSKLEDLKNG